MGFWMLLVVTVLYQGIVSSQLCTESGESFIIVRNQNGCGILDCYNQSSNVSMYANYEFTGWILRDLRIINTTYNDSRIWSEELPEHWTLTINNVSRADLGLYHCLVTEIYTRELLLIRLGLNVKGPFFINKWDEYRKPVIIGCSSFAIFIGVVIAAAVLWHFRFKSPDDDTKSMQDVVFPNEGFPEENQKDDAMRTSLPAVSKQTRDQPSVLGYDALVGVDNPAFAVDTEMKGTHPDDFGNDNTGHLVTEL